VQMLDVAIPMEMGHNIKETVKRDESDIRSEEILQIL